MFKHFLNSYFLLMSTLSYVLICSFSDSAFANEPSFDVSAEKTEMLNPESLQENSLKLNEGLAKDAVLQYSDTNGRIIDKEVIDDDNLNWQEMSLLWMETKQSEWSREIVSLAHYIDGLVGYTDSIKDNNRSYLKLYFGFQQSRFYDFEEQVSARFSLDLPLVKEKLRLVIESADSLFDDENSVSELSGEETIEDESVYASLRYLFSSDDWQRLSFDYGLKIRARPDLFARARAVRSWPLSEDWSFRYSQDIFWYESVGLGAKSGFDFDHDFQHDLLFRLANYAHWHERGSYYDLGQSVSYFHDYSKKRAMQYTFGYEALHDDNHCVLTNYYIKTNYRRNIHKNWLFYQVSTGVEFPREFGYEINPFIGIRLELLFSESVDRQLSTRMY